MPEEIFNINAKVVKLNNGYKMPIIGIGTYSLHGKACAEAGGFKERLPNDRYSIILW